MRRIHKQAVDLILLAILAVFAISSALCGASAQTFHGAADPRAIVVSGQARFTVLTPQLIRMEWAEDSHFEDHASLVFINRLMPVPPFQKTEQDGWLALKTQKLTLEYKESSGTFTRDNLSVNFTVDGKDIVWHPGDADTGNLGGTSSDARRHGRGGAARAWVDFAEWVDAG